LENLINVATSDDAVTINVIAPIRGDHGQLLQDYLRDLSTDKKIVVNLKDLDADSTAGAYCVLMAAKLRKKDGAEPLELHNVPSSLARVFNPAYSKTLGFALASVG
jgi:anti-anti-sigma regulatory factor